MHFLQLPDGKWGEFFGRMTALMQGKLVEVEVAGLDVGDQIAAEWLPLNGISYEANEDALYVYTEHGEGDVDLAIQHPREVFVELGDAGLNQVVVIDVDGRKQFVHLRAPLELPADTTRP
jgi:hypothetical protein